MTSSRRPALVPPAPRDTASLYVRLSRAARDESTGLSTQEEDLRRLAADRGLTIVGLHIDDGESGALRDRPGFLAWLADAADGRADHLLAYRLDRVSRGGTAGLARFLDTLEGVDADGVKISHGARFLSVADALDSRTPAWDIQAAVMGALAKSERDAIRSRILRSKAKAAEEGRFLGGPLPAGFRAIANPDGPGKILEPDPDTAPILREAAEVLIASGLRDAVRHLEASALRPPRARHWSRATTRQALTTKAARTYLWSPGDAALIDRALTPNTRPPVEHRLRVVALLSRVARCAGCGGALQLSGAARRRYQCPSTASGYPCPSRCSVSSALLEAAVSDAWLEGWSEHAETVAVRQADARGDRLAVLADEISSAWAAIPSLKGAGRVEALGAVEALEAEAAALEAAPVATVTALRETGRTLAEAWESADVEGRRALLLRTVGRVTVAKGTRQGERVFDLRRILNLKDLTDPA